jgi:RHS repeat-associated protein
MTAVYNGASELVSYNNSSADMSSATYDGSGLRTSATSTPSGGSPATQHFVWNTTTTEPELLSDSTNANIYDSSGAPIEQVNLSTGTIEYLLADALGSVCGVVSSSGSLVASTQYDAWGIPYAATPLTSYTPFGFAGGYTDPTGLVYLVNRYYDPTTGEFLSVDPDVRETGEPYAYTNDDPVNAEDPLGLDEEDVSGFGAPTVATPQPADYASIGPSEESPEFWQEQATRIPEPSTPSRLSDIIAPEGNLIGEPSDTGVRTLSNDDMNNLVKRVTEEGNSFVRDNSSGDSYRFGDGTADVRTSTKYGTTVDVNSPDFPDLKKFHLPKL